jgi:hypothetical protein
MKHARPLLVLAACAAPHPTTSPPESRSPHPAKDASGPLGVLLAKRSGDVSISLDGESLYQTGTGPVLISRDRGRTFQPWTAGKDLCAGWVRATTDHLVYATAAICSDTDVQRHEDELYVSEDDGATWKKRDRKPQYIRGVDGRSLYGECYDGTKDYFCASGDAGATWQPLTTPAAGGTVFAAEKILTFSHDDQIERSTDRGATWRPLISGVADVRALLSDGTLLGETTCGVYRSAGGPWEKVFGLDECRLEIFAAGAQACAVVDDHSVFASPDGGASWRPVDLPITKDLRYDCLPDGDRVLVSGEAGLVAAPFP